MQSEPRRPGRPRGSSGAPTYRYHSGAELPGAYFVACAPNRKLAPVDMVANTTSRLRPVSRGPFVSSTYVSIDATCRDECVFKRGGCYVRSGFTGNLASRLDRTAEVLRPLEVIRNEVALIDGAFSRLGHVPQDGARGGRDLRLHVGGDCPSEKAAVLLAGAAERWIARGGGRVWTYTHNWKHIDCDAWGPISVLASVETPEQAHLARQLGYRPAMVVREFPGRRAFRVGQSERFVPCPAETGVRTCVECRLCLSTDRRVAIAFAAHGTGKAAADGTRTAHAVRRLLPVLQMEASDARV